MSNGVFRNLSRNCPHEKIIHNHKKKIIALSKYNISQELVTLHQIMHALERLKKCNIVT